LWNIAWIENRDSKPLIRKQLDEFSAANKERDGAYVSMVQWYTKLGDSAAASSCKQLAFEKFPHGESAYNFRTEMIWKESDGAKRAEVIQKIVSDFPNLTEDQRKNQRENLFYAYLRAKAFDK